MRLTLQERRIVGFLLIVLLLSASIRIIEHYFAQGSPSFSDSQISRSDSLFLTKVALVDSLVRTGSVDKADNLEVQQMAEMQKSMKVYINLADQNTLMKLPRIGPAMSKRIIAHREKNGYFKSFEDLIQVKGIGPATIEKLRPLITFNTVRP